MVSPTKRLDSTAFQKSASYTFMQRHPASKRHGILNLFSKSQNPGLMCAESKKQTQGSDVKQALFTERFRGRSKTCLKDIKFKSGLEVN